jgi:DNA-binding SARP family transcriptional activator/Tfp pilus assembly protein PilF
MECTVLGPLRVGAAGEAVAVGAARKRRLVLAVLLARAGQPVPTDTLVDAVWGERPPASARRNLQLYVHQLRRLLGDQTVAARGDGYVIDLGDGLDATRFRRLAADGGRALDAGDPVTAERTLRAALDLWQGQAFGEFLDCRLVADEAQRLELLRLETYERWAEARLVTGATPQLAIELAELCQTYPYRETLRAHLMQALYQTGRQAEALAVFRETRALLVDELGIEPGLELQRLHEAMLRGDETLLPVGRPASRPAQLPLPRQLPAPPQVFTGRVGELATLRDIPEASTVVITAIDGMAGVGKTALAIHAAHRLADRYPDGQLFVDLHGYTQGVAPVEPADALDRMLRALGIPGTQVPAGVDERAALYRTRLAQQRMLVVLDNAASEAQVTPLLPGAPGCLVLVTSRRRLTGLDHTHTMSLDTLPASDAVRLFCQAAGEDRLTDQSPDLLAELVELCGRLPLAIRIAAARLRSRPTWDLPYLVGRMRDRRHRLAELEAGQRSVTAALDLSYHHLSDDQRHTYRLLGAHPGAAIDAYATAALLDSSLDHARRMLDQLLDAHLLLEPVAGRYQFHDLTRAHAAHAVARDQPEEPVRAGLDRLFAHYRHTASLAMDAAYPYEREYRPKVPSSQTPVPELADPAVALDWLDTELPNLMAIAQYATEHGRARVAVHLSGLLYRHLRTRGRYDAAETLHHHALAAARASADQAGEVEAQAGLGWVRWRQGRYEEASERYEEVLRLARGTGHHASELTALTGLGQIRMRLGRFTQAADHLEEALRIARDTGDQVGELNALNSLADLHWQQGHSTPAGHYLEQVLRIARATGHVPKEMHALTGLGNVDERRGRYARAADHYQQALRIARTTGHWAGELAVLLGLAQLYHRQGRYPDAIDHYQQLLELAQESGDRNWQFEAWQGLGRLQRDIGRPEAAIAHHEQAMAFAEQLAQPTDQARAHNGLAHAHHTLGHSEQARRHWRHALEILTSLGIDDTEEEETTVAAIRAHLAGLDQP